MKRKLNKYWKLIGGGLAVSTLLATSVVAPLTTDLLNKESKKQLNASNQKLTQISAAKNLNESSASADVFFGSTATGTIYYSQSGKDVTLLASTSQNPNSLGGTNPTLQSDFTLNGETECNVVEIQSNFLNPGLFGSTADFTGTLDLSNYKETNLSGAFVNIADTSFSVILPNNLEVIDSSAFYGSTGLTNVTFGNGLTKIGESAFYSTGLTEVDLSACENLAFIDTYAFNVSKGLSSIKLPNGKLSTISTMAFGFDEITTPRPSYTELNIPASVTIIQERAFFSQDLSTVYFNRVNPSWITDGGLNETWSKSSGGISQSPISTIYVPSETYDSYKTAIENTSWYQSLSSCNIVAFTPTPPPSPTPTFDSADKFFTSTSGDPVTGTVCYIDNGDGTITLLPNDSSSEFHNDTTTTNVTGKDLQLDTTSDGKIGTPVSDISDYTFNSSNITGALDLSLCTSLTSIGDTAFADDIEEGITHNDITSVKLPANIDEFGPGIFLGNNLTKIECTSNDNYEVWQPNPNENGQVLVEKGTSTWTNESHTLGGIACGNIDLSTYQFTKLNRYSFGGSDITNIKLPDGLTEIEGIDVDNPAGALMSCVNLTTIDLPTSITKIGPWAFASCINLSSINSDQLEKLTSIDNCAFVYCAGLSNFVVPESVKTIGSNTFGTDPEYTKFTAVTLQNTNPSWISGVDNDWLAGNYSAIKTIYVPEGCKTAYQNEYAKLYQEGTYDWFKTGMSWEEYTPPTPSDNNLNLGIALGVSLGICIGIPEIIGLGFLGKYKTEEKKQNKQD